MRIDHHDHFVVRNLGWHASPWHRVIAALNWLADHIDLWTQRGCQRRALAELDDRLLGDVGIGRTAARREAAKPFWRT